jgi:hypothetical protein
MRANSLADLISDRVVPEFRSARSCKRVHCNALAADEPCSPSPRIFSRVFLQKIIGKTFCCQPRASQ